jgi:hypothetical protein
MGIPGWPGSLLIKAKEKAKAQVCLALAFSLASKQNHIL